MSPSIIVEDRDVFRGIQGYVPVAGRSWTMAILSGQHYSTIAWMARHLVDLLRPGETIYCWQDNRGDLHGRITTIVEEEKEVRP